MQLTLSDKEAELLQDLLDWWIEDMDDATKCVEEDRSLETPEQLLRAVQGMHEQFDTAVSLRGRIHGGRKETSVS